MEKKGREHSNTRLDIQEFSLGGKVENTTTRERNTTPLEHNQARNKQGKQGSARTRLDNSKQGKKSSKERETSRWILQVTCCMWDFLIRF